MTHFHEVAGDVFRALGTIGCAPAKEQTEEEVTLSCICCEIPPDNRGMMA